MGLTMNRSDGGFGPKTNGELTTSFEDIILVPLPCWIFILSVLQLFATNRPRRTPSNVLPTTSAEGETKAAADQQAVGNQDTSGQPSRMKNIARRVTKYLLIFFTFGVLLLTIDELARLSILSWGVGLLPFVPVTAFMATALHVARNKLNLWYQPGGPNYQHKRVLGSFRSKIAVRVIPFWLGMIIVEAVKLHTLMRLEGPFPRNGSKYPTSQQVLDIWVLLACMVLVLLFTIVETIFPRVM